MEILYNMVNVSKLYELKLQPAMKKYHLLKIELDVLLFLNNNPQYDKAKEIVEMRGIAKSHVSKAIDLLHQKGMIEIRVDKKDKRVNHLLLSDKAKPVIEDGLACQKEFYRVFYKNMSNDEMKQLKKLFCKMSQNVREELKCMH